MYVPVVIMCLVAEPQSCNIFRGPMTETKDICEINIMTQGLPSLTDQYQDAYIAGISCVEVDILDQEAKLD